MIKQTKLWLKMRNLKNTFIARKIYKKAVKMPTTSYESYICEKYKVMMNRFEYTKGKTMDFDNPITFTQKQQWLSLYDQNPNKTILSDKYLVRRHVSKILGDEYLVPLISIDGIDFFTDARDIDFSKLPNQFVLKCNHGSHMNIIVKDKASLKARDVWKIKRQLNKWLNIDYTFVTCLELQYHLISRGIIIEEYLSDFNDDLPDYKILCFSGVPKYIWIDVNRFKNHTRTMFNIDGSIAPFAMGEIRPDEKVKVPTQINEIVRLAKKLCDDYAFVRVDFYCLKGKIYFGELTFSSGAGLIVPDPLEYEDSLGELINIDSAKRNNCFLYRKKN